MVVAHKSTCCGVFHKNTHTTPGASFPRESSLYAPNPWIPGQARKKTAVRDDGSLEHVVRFESCEEILGDFFFLKNVILELDNQLHLFLCSLHVLNALHGKSNSG